MIVSFVGDTSITGSFTRKIIENTEIFSSKLLSELNHNNFIICNLEGPVTNKKLPDSEKIVLSSPSNTIKYLKERNITVFNLANNHILDSGNNGLLDTLNELDKNNCKYFGAGTTLSEAANFCILKHENIKIALFGLSDSNTKVNRESTVVFSSKQMSLLKKQVAEAKKQANFIIVNFHGGEEYTCYPSPTKRSFLKKISRIKDVDIVIAHHSHTLQSYEKYMGKYIFYSLGNFIFDINLHNLHPFTKESAILKFKFSETDFSFSFFPFKIKKDGFVNDEFIGFENHFNSISDFTAYKKKWRKEAYRVLFKRKRPIFEPKVNYENSLQKKSIIKLLLDAKFYKKTIKVLFSDNYRALYIGAIIHKLFLKIKK